MPSTDIDGSPIMILSEDEARTIHRFLMCFFGRGHLIQDEIEVGNKIAKTFGLEPVGPSRSIVQTSSQDVDGEVNRGTDRRDTERVV